jgi:biopolymer transport protein ExbD
MKLRKQKIDDIPQSSMSDVAFLLLVFFIATTIFNTEQGIPLSLPGKTSLTTQLNPKNILRLSSDPGGQIFIDDEPIAMHQIEAEVRTRLAENPNLVVAIETHPDGRYGVMVQVLDEVKQAEATRISLQIQRGV